MKRGTKDTHSLCLVMLVGRKDGRSRSASVGLLEEVGDEVGLVRVVDAGNVELELVAEPHQLVEVYSDVRLD